MDLRFSILSFIWFKETNGPGKPQEIPKRFIEITNRGTERRQCKTFELKRTNSLPKKQRFIQLPPPTTNIKLTNFPKTSSLCEPVPVQKLVGAWCHWLIAKGTRVNIGFKFFGCPAELRLRPWEISGSKAHEKSVSKALSHWSWSPCFTQRHFAGWGWNMMKYAKTFQGLANLWDQLIQALAHPK